MDEFLKKFWQDNLTEIRENKFRFAAICFCFVAAVVLFFANDDDGEEIILTENPAPAEFAETAENPDTNKKIIVLNSPAISSGKQNIKIVSGANAEALFVHDPFKIPIKEKIQPQPEIILPSVEEIPPVSNEKFILRGTAIIGDNKSALVQKISSVKDSDAENLILGIGEDFNGKMIIEITPDFLILIDGTKIFIETN